MRHLLSVILSAMLICGIPATESAATAAETEATAPAAKTEATSGQDLFPTEAQLRKAAEMPHPRLVASAADFKVLKKALRDRGNLSLANAHAVQMALAESFAASAQHLVYKKDESGRRILAVSRDALQQLLTLAYAWRISPDRKYVARAESILRDVCGFSDWNNAHFLDTAEMAAAVAFAYDWMYKALSPEVRALAENALMQFALRDDIKRRYLSSDNNWNQVCNAGIVCASIAVLDKYPEVAARRIVEAIGSNRPIMDKMYEPDGVYPEGPTYWSYGTMFEILLLKALGCSFGSDFGLSCHPGFRATGRYQVYSQSGTGRYFNFYDSGEMKVSSPELWYFAAENDDWGLVRYEATDLAAKDLSKITHRDAGSRLMPIYFPDIARMGSRAAASEPEGIFHGQGTTPVAIARYGWDHDNAYFGIKAGCASDHHAHMDAASFVYDAYGYRWASDPVKPGYSLSEFHFAKYGTTLWSSKQDSWRWRICTYNNFYHNTVSVNGKKHVVGGRALLGEITDTPDAKGATIDYSAVLAPDLSRAVRRGELHRDGSLEISDEFKAHGFPAFIRWTLVTPARAEIRSDGIHLFQGDVEMLLSCEGAEVDYAIWPGKEDPKENPVASFDPGVSQTVCGFTFVVPANKKTLSIKTTFKKL